MNRKMKLAIAAFVLAVSLASYGVSQRATTASAAHDEHDEHDVRELAYSASPAQQLPAPAVTTLADGVYHYFGFFTSSLIVVADDGALITDPSNDFRAQSLKEEIAKITDSPVTSIALTHEHYDHVGGTSLFPDAEIICHRNCAPNFALDTLGDVPELDTSFDDKLMDHAINAHSPGTDPIDLMENVEYCNDLYDAVYGALATAANEGGQLALFGVFRSLPQTLRLDKYADCTNYESSFPRHVERMLQSITHAD